MATHPRKSPERVLQSQIDVAQNQYLWTCSAFHFEHRAKPDGYWAKHFDAEATRWEKAWDTLRTVQANG